MANPAIMLVSPRKRICPSVMRVARSNTLRQDFGLRNGSNPSITSISASAASRMFHKGVGSVTSAAGPQTVRRFRAWP